MSPSQPRHFVTSLFALAVPALLIGGCVHHHHDDYHDQVTVVDEHGYHHEGYRDDHGWHGGYYDEQHQYHADSGDWAGDRR